MDMEWFSFIRLCFRREGLLITEANPRKRRPDRQSARRTSANRQKQSERKIELGISDAIQSGDGSLFLDLKPIGKEKILFIVPADP